MELTKLGCYPQVQDLVTTETETAAEFSATSEHSEQEPTENTRETIQETRANTSEINTT